jgi:hypothetical protein
LVTKAKEARMKRLRISVLGTLVLAVAACAELPSWDLPAAGMGGSGATTGGSSVIPNGGSKSSTTGGSGGSAPNLGGSSATGASGPSSGGSGPMSGGTGGGMTSGGSSPTGGSGPASGGSGGDTTSGGTGGTGPDPQLDIDDAVKNLKGWRYENKCGYVDGHSITDGTCNSGEICFPSSQKARFTEHKSIAIGGTPGQVYDVTLRIRGALEPRDYPQNCTRLPGAPENTVGVLTNCDGFANKLAVTFNVFELKIPDPPAVYYMNGVPVHPPHRVDPIDQTFGIKVTGGTTLEFTFDDLNGGEIRNCSITVEGVEPYPKVFDGNFFQLDVVEAKLAP